MKGVEEILSGLDKLFEEQRMAEVEPYLQHALQVAMNEGDSSTIITLVNELIGFYRDTSQYEKSLYYCEHILPFMDKCGLKETIHYATTCLNVANAYRAAGAWSESLQCYEEVKSTYDRILPPADSLYASYYNNFSLLHQEMGDFTKAAECLKKALSIIESYDDIIKVAITCSNLAASLLRIGQQQQAEAYLNRALQIFIDDGERDFHYGAALSVMGEVQYGKGNYEESVKYYQRALNELEKHVGKTEYYYRTLDNLEQAEKKLQKQSKAEEEGKAEETNSNSHQSHVPIDLGNEKQATEQKSLGRQMFEDFYYEYGEPMLKEKFPAFLDKIAVGKVGEGSDCFGFDDEASRDHDFGPGFCMWVTKETYEQIGELLQKEYEKLPNYFRGVRRHTMETGRERVGVCIIEEFYQRILGMEKAPDTLEEWSKLEEFALATATNGWVLKDEEGIFSEIRNKLLAYYPDEIWRTKIAQALYSISQNGQYNYGRMARRSDVVTAEQCRSQFIKYVMELVYLLNRSYAPYYKWMFKGLENLDDFGIGERLVELVFVPIMDIEENEKLMEQICVFMLQQMEKAGIIKQNSQTTYLEHYIGQVLKYTSEKRSIKTKKDMVSNKDTKEQNSSMEDEKESLAMNEKTKLVERLVNLEWQNFDKVKNEGGRADCQDDWGTFSIMRTSQYLTWTEEMLQSYIQDFKDAMAKGWNLITEKYGRMMETTAPKRYEEIKDQFPFLAEEKKRIIEEIVKIQVTWMEEFAAKYPFMAGNSRVIHTKEDTMFSTSFETYLRGEMSTYSDRTLDLYGRFIVSYLQQGRNLTKDIMTNTALLYGYESLEKAEELLAKA